MKKCLILAFLLMSLTATAEQVYVNDVTIDYEVFGTGPPLYLLHGGLESRDSFSNQIPAFAEHFTVVALDSRDQGRSVSPDAPVSYEFMADDVLALAKRLGHDRINLAGQSDGGATDRRKTARERRR